MWDQNHDTPWTDGDIYDVQKIYVTNSLYRIPTRTFHIQLVWPVYWKTSLFKFISVMAGNDIKLHFISVDQKYLPSAHHLHVYRNSVKY